MGKLSLFLFISLCMLPLVSFLSGSAEARVGSRTVEAVGHGSSIDAAIDRAMVSAITQVNGAAIASRARSSLSATTSTAGEKQVSRSQKSFKENIAKKTKGIVQSYDILSQGRAQGSSLYRVKLSVTVATYKKSAQLNRLRMALVPFRLDTSLKGSKAGRRFEELFRRGLENYLTQTRRFAMLDRSFIAEQNDEFSFLLGKDVTQKDSPKASKMPPRKQRFALVIGNGAYLGSPLRKTLNDARGMAKKLGSLGFKVTTGVNLNQREMMGKLVKFKQTLMKAPSDATALFYFSGHGLSLNGTNWLQAIEEKKGEGSGVRLNLVMNTILANYKGVKIILIDACRNAAFFAEDKGRELFSPPKPRENTFIGFASAPGTSASESRYGQYGNYTGSILKYLDLPNIKIEDLFKRVRENTLKLSNREQIPWENSSLVGDFYFNGGGGTSIKGSRSASKSGENFAGGTATEELARIGNRVGTDYLVTGIVEKAYSGSKKYKMRTTGQVITTPQIGGRITYRILDVASTQVKFASTDKIHRESGSMDSAADSLAAIVGQKILNAIFPVYVLSVDGDQLTLGQGGDTIKKGSVYSLVKLGEEIIDPYTRESLGQSEKTVGSVRVIETQSKLSTAKVLKLNIKTSDLMKYDFIVRPRKGISAAKKNAKKMKDFEKEFDKEFDKDDEEDKKEKW